MLEIRGAKALSEYVLEICCLTALIVNNIVL